MQGHVQHCMTKQSTYYEKQFLKALNNWHNLCWHVPSYTHLQNVSLLSLQYTKINLPWIQNQLLQVSHTIELGVSTQVSRVIAKTGVTFHSSQKIINKQEN